MHKTSRREFQPDNQSQEISFFKQLDAISIPGVRIYQIHLNHPAGLDTSKLTEAELARGNRMRNANLRQHALAGRVALREILAIETGSTPASLRITTEPAGKPILADHPIHFSLAHTGGFAAVAVCDAAPVGIDIECTGRDTSFEGIASRFFHPGEVAWLKDDLRMNFFRLWISKEAILKCTGEGISHHLAELRTQNLTASDAVIDYAGRLWRVEFLNSLPGLLISIAAEHATSACCN